MGNIAKILVYFCIWRFQNFVVFYDSASDCAKVTLGGAPYSWPVFVDGLKKTATPQIPLEPGNFIWSLDEQCEQVSKK